MEMRSGIRVRVIVGVPSPAAVAADGLHLRGSEPRRATLPRISGRWLMRLRKPQVGAG